MSDQYQMTSVVRRIESSQRKAAEVQGTIVTLGEGFLSKKSHYVVITPRHGAGSARCHVSISMEAPERKWALPLEFLLVVQFSGRSEADAKKLIDAIHQGDNPDQALTSLVSKWLDDFLKDQKITKAGFIERFLGLRQDLAGHLIKAASSVALAIIEIEIKIRGEAGVSSVLEIKLENSTVVLNDYKPEVMISVDTDLERMPESILPYLENNSHAVITGEIRRELRDQFRTRGTLHSFQYDKDGKVREIVDEVIRGIAENHGRKIARLMISRKAPIADALVTFEMKMAEEKFKQLDYPDPVQVDIDFKLTLAELGELVRSGVDRQHLDLWARATLREIVSRRLLGVHYVDLFPQFDDKLAETHTAFADAARDIGYDLTRFILQTNLDFHVLQRGFECRIENAKFPLKLRECEVILDIETVLRITNKSELQRLFSQNTAITQTITDTVRNAVARTLREVSPEEFYLRFYGTDEATEKSVAERLEDAVREACKDFKPESGMRVHVTQRADELSGIYGALVRSEMHLTEVHDPNTRLTANVKASVNSISMNHWRKFQDRKPNLEQVGASLQLHVLSFLNEYGKQGFKKIMNTPGTIVSEHVEKWVNDRLAEEYGLGVHIDHWFLFDEKAGNKIDTWNEQIESLTGTLSDLTAQRAKAFSEGETERVGELTKQITQAEAMRDDLYRERGGKGSIFDSPDPNFKLEAKPIKQLQPEDKSKSKVSGEQH